MRIFTFIGLSALVLAILSPEIGHTCDADCPDGFPKVCTTNVITRDCMCRCLPKKDIQKRRQKQILANFIQDNESVDKSKIVNLDEVVQKAVEESSQKLDTPVTFKVQVQDKENAPPREVEYQIKTSR